MGLRSIHDNVCQADVHVTLGPERWGRSTYGLSLGNLTTYPATNCIQGLDPPSFFFLISAIVPQFDCHSPFEPLENTPEKRKKRKKGMEVLIDAEGQRVFRTSKICLDDELIRKSTP